MEEVMLEKAKFLSDNKDKIINNLTKVSYPLFKILSSDDALEEIEEYKRIINFLNEAKTEVLFYEDKSRDEKYILETILAFVNKAAVDINEVENARICLSRYDRFFERKKVRIKVQNA